MAHKLYLPAIHQALSETLSMDDIYKGKFITISKEKEQLEKVLNDSYNALYKLDTLLENDAMSQADYKNKAFFAADVLKGAMVALRKPIDEAELLVPKKEWPVPTYGDLLFHF